MEKRPYGELGSVSKGNCCCCVSANSGLGEIQPGCGCDEARVDEIVTELKTRMRARGDTAQILRSEETLQRLDKLDAKLVRIKVIERLFYSANENLYLACEIILCRRTANSHRYYSPLLSGRILSCST